MKNIKCANKMPRYQAELSKLVIFNSQRSKNFVSCFITQPKIDEERLGQIFIILEIKPKNVQNFSVSDCQKFLDILVKIIKNNYYYKNKDAYESGSIELLFEAAIQKTNKELQAYLLQLGTRMAENFLDNANIAIGVVFKHQIHFSVIGNIEAFLARKNKISDILAAGNEAASANGEEKINIAKIFSHLISGNLETDDGLIFCTPNLLDYFSLEKLRRIINQNSSTKSTQNLAELLAEVDEKAAIAAILIKLASGKGAGEEKREYPKPYYKESRGISIFRKPAKKNVQDSIADLLNRQEETSKIITPSLMGAAKKLLSKLRTPKKQKSIYGSKDLARTIKEKAGLKSQHFSKSTRPRSAMKKLGDLIKLLLTKIFNRKKITPALGQIKSTPPKKLGLASKAILVVCIIFGVLFIQSLFNLNKQRVEEKSDEIFLTEIEKINQEKERANTRLIIGDQTSAMDSFEKILEEIKELTITAPEQQIQADSLKQEIESKINEINKIKKATLKEVINLGGLSFFAENTPEKMVIIKDKIYIAASDDSLYVNNLETGEVKELVKFNLGKIKMIKKMDEENLIIKYDSSLAGLNILDGSVTPLALEAREDLVIDDFEIYNNRLYVLDAEKNLILKYSRSGNTFSGEANWLKADINIRDAAALVIDASIWVLKTDGEIVNLMKGAEGEFPMPEVRPTMIRPSKLWTDLEIENLYLMDAATKRIVAVTKKGEIKQQYTSDELDDFKDFVVDKKNNAIYILDGLKIYKVEIN